MPTSWNRLPKVRPARLLEWADRGAPLPESQAPLLAWGNGRSGGDVCLNDGGTLLLTRGMDRLIAFDRATGVLECESGILLSDLLHWCLPQGWMLPVVPGTQFITVGGAIANDVHGRNHRTAGSFGRHLLEIELLRSTGERLRIAPGQKAGLFAATVGGLGLTGLITRARLQLVPVHNDLMLAERTRFGHLDGFWDLDERRGPDWPYTTAWIDCMARGRSLGRGVFLAGRHAPPQPAETRLPRWRHHPRAIPFELPRVLFNRHGVRTLNALYYRAAAFPGTRLQRCESHLFPFDGIRNGPRIDGRRGLHRYQCVLPPGHARDAVRVLLRRVAASGLGSFPAWLQSFGDLPSPGMLSFPCPGITLALEFADRGTWTQRLFADLDDIVSAAGGALYPGQDARMSMTMFRRGFPQWERFATFTDPAFSSNFWRRMNP